MVGCSNNISKIIYAVNNLIMDIDVYRRLDQNYNFQRSSNCGEIALCEAIEELIKNYGNDLLNGYDTKYLSCFVVFVTLHFNEGKGFRFSKKLQELNSVFEKYYNGLIEIININHQIGYTHVREMQVQAMALFDLQCYKFV